MPTYGNDEDGFSIECLETEVRVVGIGFWSAVTCVRFQAEVMDALSSGRRARLVLHLSELRPLREEGQAAFRSVMARALTEGVRTIEFRGVSALTKLQMLRLSREMGRDDFVRFV